LIQKKLLLLLKLKHIDYHLTISQKELPELPEEIIRNLEFIFNSK